MDQLKGRTIEAYNKGAERYAEKFNSIGSRVEDIEKGLSYVSKTSPRALEIGCGNGRDGGEIAKRVGDYTGIDASEEMIRLAKDRFPEANFLVADMENYEFPEGVDIIYAFASLLHLDKDSIINVLKKAHTALNENGIFYISVKYGDYQEKVFKDDFGERTFFFYDENDFAELAGDLYQIECINKQTLHEIEWMTVVLRKK